MVILVGAQLDRNERLQGEKYMEEKNQFLWRKEHERYFNETIIRSRCTLWTSDKKMEP